MTDLEKRAKVLFETDQNFDRDRRLYGKFEAMPPELQQWWKDRAWVQELTALGDPHT